MSNGFGKSQEVQDGPMRKLYTGVENFKVVGVNPTKQELEAMYGREINYDPEYIGTTKVEDGDGEREVPQIRLDFYLANEDESVTTKIQFYVANTHHKSQTGKFKVINDFGRVTWLDQQAIQTKQMPDNMSWYNASGVKVAKRGEEELISFLVNLLNLPYKIDELKDKSDAFAKISAEEWKKIFSGDISLFRNILGGTNNKVGVLLGVKTKTDGKLVQTVFNRHTLRQYSLHSTRVDKFKYLAKDVTEAKEAGAFGNVNFGASDYELREFTVGATEINTENTNQTDIFDTPVETHEFADNSDWMDG